MGAAPGRPGTTADGIAAAQRVLAANGVPTDGFDVHDGSGLAPDDRVRCATLLGVIDLAATPRFAALGAGLSVAGQSGTLAERFRGDPLDRRLHAKTGTLDGVTGLVGLVDAGAHPRFALLASGNFSTGAAQVLQAAVAEAVARAPAIHAPANLVPAP
jgi:D-alanyl-D-alanine carboxypeptidase/D-alanyl-D-alanine-endopeptidase (penicillin-binding protein 4)